MAESRPTTGEEPEPESLDALHVHLVDFVCEELLSLADDSGDERAEEYDQTIAVAGSGQRSLQLAT